MICYTGDDATAAGFIGRGAFNSTQMNDVEVRTYSGMKIADNFDSFWGADISAYRGGVWGLWRTGSLNYLAAGCNPAGGAQDTCSDWTDNTAGSNGKNQDPRQLSTMTSGGSLVAGSPDNCAVISNNAHIPCLCYVGS